MPHVSCFVCAVSPVCPDDHDDYDVHGDHDDHLNQDAHLDHGNNHICKEVGGFLTRCARIAASITLNEES